MKLQKITRRISANAASGRSYHDACGAAHGLDLVGERWALLVMRELLLGPKRFGDLRADLPGISANILTQRLEGLEPAGILTRKKLPPPVSAQVYELTPWGYESEPVLRTLGQWAARSPAHDPTLPLSAVSLLLSFRAMFDPARAKGFKARVGLRIDDETFVVRIADGKVSSERAALDDADAVLSGPARAIAGVIYGGQPLPTSGSSKNGLTVEGDLAIARRFATLFPLPAKAAIGA